MSFRVVEVRGNAFERGKKYGELAKDLIKKNLSYYMNFWRNHLGIDEKSLKDASESFSEAIEEFDDELFREIKGISEGCNEPLSSIVLMNARYELGWLGEALKSQGCLAEGCTSVGTLPEVSNGRTFVAQNWDYKEHFLETTVILKIIREDAPDIITKTEAGIITQQGINSEGIAVAMNALVSSEDSFGKGVPVMLIMRKILDSADFSTALKCVYNVRSNVSANFMIGAPGEVLNLEMTPRGVSCLHPRDGIITHSNHFLRAHLEHDLGDRFISVLPDTLFRHERARRILRGRVSFEKISEALSDHFNYPNSICRHTDERVDEFTRLVTVSSLIMDLDSRTLFFTQGNPCLRSYRAERF
ncbi:MAG: isopenicillin-N N-acyltransferase like protein [Archaeoglobi archaeon]|nr:isopenicillin-N N-acyltransferase like protein [Archaeoglobi archaeon]MDK2782263.1 isopenicillin-N N-acyltransferase like protein [Archaeoglobi archaeon]